MPPRRSIVEVKVLDVQKRRVPNKHYTSRMHGHFLRTQPPHLDFHRPCDVQPSYSTAGPKSEENTLLSESSRTSNQRQRVRQSGSVPPSCPRQDQGSTMTEQSEELKNSLPTERKLVWRTAEERRMSDLTRVLEWLERRQGKKKQDLQKNKSKVVTDLAEPAKEEKKTKTALKHQGVHRRNQGRQQVAFSEQISSRASGQNSKDDETSALYRRLYRVEAKGKRHSSLTPSTNPKDTSRKSDLDIKDAVAQESTQRPMPYRRQSIVEPVLQDAAFAQRKSTLLREWGSKMPDASYERKLKSLMEKGTEPKMEMMKMLKPEEVLSCRYLRLSKNNIRTLLKLCKDAGMNVDIHPHMIEGEIDAKKVFNQNISVAL